MSKILDFIEDNYPTEIGSDWEKGFAYALDEIEKIEKVENKDQEETIDVQKELIQNQEKIIKTQEEMIKSLKEMVDKQHAIIAKFFKGVDEITECIEEEALDI